MIYFTSDLHFGHKNVISFTGRPFSGVEEMDEALIQNWNQTVRPDDEVYLLGDVTMKGGAFAGQRLNRLHGRKYLVRGNHDHFVRKCAFDASLFAWVKDYAELSYQNQIFILFHYPIQEWNGMFSGAFHLHGHQHQKKEYNLENREKGIRRFDVGVDANDMFPVSIESILQFFGV